VSSSSRSTVWNVTGCSATTTAYDSGVPSSARGAPPPSIRKNSPQSWAAWNPSHASCPIGSAAVPPNAKYAFASESVRW
jgi:hypothetical protein